MRKKQAYKSKLIGSAAMIAITVLIAPQPSVAQMVVADPTKMAFDTIEQMRSGWADYVHSQNQFLQSDILTKNTDTATANARTNLDAATAMTLSQQTARPMGHSSCRIAQGASTASADAAGGRAVTQALAQAGSPRPATVGANAQEIKAQCALNFAPVSTNDPEAANYKALGCNSDGSHARQDRTVEALLGSLQLPVPSNFTPPVLGVYQPMKAVVSQGDYPFAAALTFCQHIAPRLPLPSQNASMSAIDAAAIGAYADHEAAASVGGSSCFKALEHRMQYGENVANGFQQRHADQVKRCLADAASGFIDTPALTDCKKNGRSELQADHDLSYRREAESFHTVFLIGADRNAEITAIGQAISDEKRFDASLAEERAQLTNAIATSNGIATGVSGDSGLTQKVQ